MLDKTVIQRITLIFGIVYLLVAIAGFIPGLTTASDVPGNNPNEGLIMGIFGTNLLHNLSHFLFAAILIVGGLSKDFTLSANRIMFVVFLVTVLGQFIDPVVNGLALNTPDLVLHLASALLTGYLGFLAHRSPVRVGSQRPM